MTVTITDLRTDQENYLIPAPFVNITKSFDKQGDGEIIGVTYSITLNGTLLADKGSPLSHKGIKYWDDEKGLVEKNDIKTGNLNKGSGFIDRTMMNTLIAGTVGGQAQDDYSDGQSCATLTGSDHTTCIQKYGINEEFYLSLQHKQKALMSLFSKLHEGAMLEVKPPRHLNSTGVAGFKAFVTFESIDLPAHNPGNPTKADYTINLKADVIEGPDGVKDQEDWELWDRWFVKAASETWDIAELDGKYGLERANDRGQTYKQGVDESQNDDDVNFRQGSAGWNSDGTQRTLPNGDLVAQHKVYALTHTMSATGKNKFDRTANNVHGIKGHKKNDASNYTVSGLIEDLGGENEFTDTSGSSTNKDIDDTITKKGDGFSASYAPNGRAWQQARGFIYDIIKYGERFISGDNATFADTAATTDYKNNSTKDGSGPDENTEIDYDNFHTFGINLPKTYKGYNYKRVQSVDKRGGSFNMTETWLLAPKGTMATETVDVSINEAGDGGGDVQVTINGTIEGLIDNAVDNSTTDDNVTDDKDKNFPAGTTDEFRNTFIIAPNNTDEVIVRDTPHHDGNAALPAHGTHSADNPKRLTTKVKSKYENARDHFNQKIQPRLHMTAQQMVDDFYGFEEDRLHAMELGSQNEDNVKEPTDSPYNMFAYILVHPVPTNKSISSQVGTGTITYNFSFNTRHVGHIPFCTRESVSVSTNYPGMQMAQHQVIGRSLGPVMQSLGTQTAWTRSLSMECQVDVRRPYLCVDGRMFLVHPYSNSKSCSNALDAYGEELMWIENPNFFNMRTAIRENIKNTDDEVEGTIKDSRRRGATMVMSSAKPSNLINHWYKVDSDANGYKKAQADAIVEVINSFDPYSYRNRYYSEDPTDDTVGENMVRKDNKKIGYNEGAGKAIGVNRSFHDAPAESWNPMTGAWSYSINWTYELNDPYTQGGGTYLQGIHNDLVESPYPGDNI